jgi:heme exporter protein A
VELLHSPGVELDCPAGTLWRDWPRTAITGTVSAASPQPAGLPPLDRIVIEGVSQRYGRTLALSGVKLTVTRGRPCVLMGHNGAGKSTLVNVLSTALEPTAGKVIYLDAEGQPVSGHALRRRLGYVTHLPMVYRELSAFENVQFFARLGGVPDPDAASRASIVRMGLDPDSSKPAAQFSRGMLARLAAARALVTEPELLLLDEAASGLDLRGREILVGHLAALASDRVVVMASHDVGSAAQLAAQLVVIQRGKVVRDDDLSARSVDERRAHILEALTHDPG